MSGLYPYCSKIRLHVKGRILPKDATRQEKTAREILKRLRERPGVILADEVGMGKTFVALAVAVSTALADREGRPVVVMVPPSLRDKWPNDFEFFRERCLPQDLRERINYGRAQRAVEFLKLLDDPLERRKQILFVTHGAMSRGLNDKWVKLAIIAQSIRGRHGVNEFRWQLTKVLSDLLHLPWVERNGKGVWHDLLTSRPGGWLGVLRKWGIDPEGDENPDTDDDPVPQAVCAQLPDMDASAVFEALKGIPKRRTASSPSRLAAARRAINAELRGLWQVCVRSLRLRLPLLILDEAHHLKNPDTKLASLFKSTLAHEDAEEIARGALGGVFERMLFLTATPFQLGHSELCNVLERFGGISWEGRQAPGSGRDGFKQTIEDLRSRLDRAQEAAVTLDTNWGRLKHEDLYANGRRYPEADEWWAAAQGVPDLTPTARQVLQCYSRADAAMRCAESELRPWVIRHLKPRLLPLPHDSVKRRDRLTGGAILLAEERSGDGGIRIIGKALLPFLLAARASSHAPESRPVFAEGLASSYEAFLQTRRARKNLEGVVDGDEDPVEGIEETDAMRWYLDHLETLIPGGDAKASASHPKVSATVERVLDIWRQGEKVLVFCHYIATGRILRARISDAIREEIRRQGARKLRCKQAKVYAELERIGARFFDEDSPIRRACDEEVRRLLEDFADLPHDDLTGIVRRYVRTPSFLVRFFPLASGRLSADSMVKALNTKDRSGLQLRDVLVDFFMFLMNHCGAQDRERYITAVKGIQTGTYMGADVTSSFAPDELQGEREETLVPNVRLANGGTKADTRQRLMLTFNTPFYPEVLVASSVMAEGVDLHLSCRHVIHHDLCWNPSTLEQRTGRIDRIGAKAERCGQSIQVYLPYVAETQDEKMYRVVMDRERWFGVVMGEDYKVDARTTERLSNRIPFPETAARRLAFRLKVAGA